MLDTRHRAYHGAGFTQTRAKLTDQPPLPSRRLKLIRTLLWILVGVAVVGAVALFVIPREAVHTPEGGTTTTQSSFGGPFTLVGADGKPFSSARLEGKPYAI